MNEARITINGVSLDEAQSATLRCAVTSFHAELCDSRRREELGAIGPLYLARLNELLRLIIPPPQVEFWVCVSKDDGAERIIRPSEVDAHIMLGHRVFRRSGPASRASPEVVI